MHVGLLTLFPELFEPFHGSGQSAGLAVATARRLIENQHGRIRAELAPGCLRYVIELPLANLGAAATGVKVAGASATRPAVDERV